MYKAYPTKLRRRFFKGHFPSPWKHFVTKGGSFTQTDYKAGCHATKLRSRTLACSLVQGSRTWPSDRAIIFEHPVLIPIPYLLEKIRVYSKFWLILCSWNCNTHNTKIKVEFCIRSMEILRTTPTLRSNCEPKCFKMFLSSR